jgi:2-oxoglutarate dehydrogenase E2 component (dihydrolipoamide succinyltransferase)
VTKKDILAFVEGGAPTEAPPQAPTAPAPAPEAPPPVAAEAPRVQPQAQPATQAGEPAPGESFEPMTAMRKGIAEHMRRSLDTSAHVTTTFEVDLSKVVAIRQKLKREYEERHGVKLTYLAFIARATLDAIAKWPWMNAEIRGESIVTKSYVNLGIAVALEGGGLIVPVIKGADEKNVVGLARAINDVATRARSKKLSPDDLSGGTFTITNPGPFGSVISVPIIPQGQAAIIGFETITKRVVVTDDDAIAIRSIGILDMSWDHRIIDGAEAARFLAALKEKIETTDFSAELTQYM